ncbi:MAG TPA: MerR family transcriptional regulator [Actinospica sp.]|jgi:DNA-binding transcriptional MerR regulator|nr:MerR family transcriptional regulator [Actinospica sp.]
MTESDADEVSTGEFARLSRLSPKALRLYDHAGVLEPVRVDPVTGSRHYARGQVERAYLVSALRQVGIPLAEIKSALGDEGTLGADLIAAFWAEAEAEHAARRRLVGSLIERLRGNDDAPSMAYAVSTRSLPDRSVLTQTRHLHIDEQTALREEFVGTLRDAGVKPLPGAVGAPFIIYYGDVSADSDGPIEWCWPVADEHAQDLAHRFPDLTLRTDPAHQEAYVHYGATTLLHAARIVLAAQSLLAWARDQDRQTVGPLRLVYLEADGEGTIPDCDVSVPLK